MKSKMRWFGMIFAWLAWLLAWIGVLPDFSHHSLLLFKAWFFVFLFSVLYPPIVFSYHDIRCFITSLKDTGNDDPTL